LGVGERPWFYLYAEDPTLYQHPRFQSFYQVLPQP
jgi:hypothetical protein